MKGKASARFGSVPELDWLLAWPWIANLTQCLDLNKKRNALISQKHVLEHPCYEILISQWLSTLHNIELIIFSSFSLNYQPRSRRFCHWAQLRCTCDHKGLEPSSRAEYSRSGSQSHTLPPWPQWEEALHEWKDWTQRCSLGEEASLRQAFEPSAPLRCKWLVKTLPHLSEST